VSPSREKELLANNAEHEAVIKENSKLEPYRNTWHERVIREEVKQAAKDGKTKLQFPTGETAKKIEGLGHTQTWSIDTLTDADYARMKLSEVLAHNRNNTLTPEKMKVGQTIKQNNVVGNDKWIITDVLGDGKFKAVSKDVLTRQAELVAKNERPGYLKNRAQAILDGETPTRKDFDDIMDMSLTETFDISGKVDTENPIYKFYEKEVGKYLKNKYGAELVTDAQGVKWWEVRIKPEMKKLPVEAFGVLPLLDTEDE